MALVVFLRGVNVGGHRTFRPSVLARELAAFGVINIGAAGTFVITKPTSQAELRVALLQKLPFETEIMICSAKELVDIVSVDPFAGEPLAPDIVRFISVLPQRLKSLPRLPLVLNPGDQWLVKLVGVKGRFAFGLYRRALKTIAYLGQVEKRIGVKVTTRNWNTIQAIVKILKSGAA